MSTNAPQCTEGTPYQQMPLSTQRAATRVAAAAAAAGPARRRRRRRRSTNSSFSPPDPSENRFYWTRGTTSLRSTMPPARPGRFAPRGSRASISRLPRSSLRGAPVIFGRPWGGRRIPRAIWLPKGGALLPRSLPLRRLLSLRRNPTTRRRLLTSEPVAAAPCPLCTGFLKNWPVSATARAGRGCSLRALRAAERRWDPSPSVFSRGGITVPPEAGFRLAEMVMIPISTPPG
mmetsp:Transcript_306/g.863  ORF Transcript_306/g.863 Transcript_306/m.863 type:complete len:232 (-) Transcript_306:86-781(-)